MRRIILSVSLLLAVMPAMAGQSNTTQPDKTPKEQFDAIRMEFQKLQRQWSKLYTSAKTDEERKEAMLKQPKIGPFAEKILW